LLQNFRLLCKNWLLIFAVILPLRWLLHLPVWDLVIIGCFLIALLRLICGLNGGFLDNHLLGRVFHHRLRRGDLLDEAELPRFKQGDILVLHLV
jgi:hypothetical protein